MSHVTTAQVTHSLVNQRFASEKLVRVYLCRIAEIGRIEPFLDAEQDLFDRDGWFPRLLLVQDREADRAARIAVGVKKRRRELTCSKVRSVEGFLAITNI